MKRSDSPVKVLNPGAKRLWRVYDERGVATADVLSAGRRGARRPAPLHLHHHARSDLTRTVTAGRGRRAAGAGRRRRRHRRRRRRDELGDVAAADARRLADLERLDPGVRRLVNPHQYHVSITDAVDALKRRLLAGF